MSIGVGFFDESTDDKGVCFVVAGFAASNAETVSLELRRADLLKKYNLEYFKASELNAGEGQFRQHRDDPNGKTFSPFSAAEKEKFTEIKTAFTDAIVETEGLNGIGAAVILRDYQAIVRDYPNANLSKPYFLAAGTVMMEMGLQVCAENQNYRESDRVFMRPVFDSHKEYSSQVKLGFDSFRRNNPISAQYLLPPYYEDDKTYLSLQAADNLAFETRKFATGQREDLPVRISMSRLMEVGQIWRIFRLNYDALKTLVEAQDPEFHLKPLDYTLADILRIGPSIKVGA